MDVLRDPITLDQQGPAPILSLLRNRMQGQLGAREQPPGEQPVLRLAGIGLAVGTALGANNVLTVSGGSSGPVALHLDPAQSFAGFAFHDGTDLTVVPAQPSTITGT